MSDSPQKAQKTKKFVKWAADIPETKDKKEISEMKR